MPAVSWFIANSRSSPSSHPGHDLRNDHPRVLRRRKSRESQTDARQHPCPICAGPGGTRSGTGESGHEHTEVCRDQERSGQQIQRDKQFALVFTESELEQACQLRQPDGMPLQWGHLSKVFALPNRKERLVWLKKAAKHGWPADVFSRQIAGARRQGGRHGRGIKPPSSVADGLNQLARDGELWLRRLKVVVHFINEQAGGDSSPKDLAVALNTLVESRSKKDRQELLKELRPLIEQLADVMGRMRQSCTATTNRTCQRMLGNTK